jgi:hypothetical protein
MKIKKLLNEDNLLEKVNDMISCPICYEIILDVV